MIHMVFILKLRLRARIDAKGAFFFAIFELSRCNRTNLRLNCIICHVFWAEIQVNKSSPVHKVARVAAVTQVTVSKRKKTDNVILSLLLKFGSKDTEEKQINDDQCRLRHQAMPHHSRPSGVSKSGRQLNVTQSMFRDYSVPMWLFSTSVCCSLDCMSNIGQTKYHRSATLTAHLSL